MPKTRGLGNVVDLGGAVCIVAVREQTCTTVGKVMVCHRLNMGRRFPLSADSLDLPSTCFCLCYFTSDPPILVSPQKNRKLLGAKALPFFRQSKKIQLGGERTGLHRDGTHVQRLW